MIASDIHGSAYYCRKMLDLFGEEKADRLLLLGDILYHGPRNDLPRGYAPKEVAEMLNGIKEKILCVRGNCEAEVDQMMLEFPCLADYAVLRCGNRLIYATHGHIYNEESLPPICEGDVLLFGHTHVPKCERRDSFIAMNPGSVSIPKEESRHSCIIYDENMFLWKDLDGNIFNSVILK